MLNNIFSNAWGYLVGGVVAVLGLVLVLRKGKKSQPVALQPVLEKLGEEYTVFADVVVAAQNGMSCIDFVVVSSYGVFVIDVRRERGKVAGSVGDREWELDGNRTIYNPVWRNRTHVNGLEKFLGSLPYVSLIVFVNARLKSDFADNVVELRQMIPFIQRHQRSTVSPERQQDAIRALERKPAEL